MSEDVLERPEVDALYALDPHEFVAARDALSKELKAAGDAAAPVVKALKRPTKVAWALNQVARQQPDEVAALLHAGAELRDRQADALSGGDAAALREAATVRRQRLSTVLAAVVAIGGDGVREDAAGTLEAASVDAEVGALLSSGRLTTAVPRPADLGFGGMPEVAPRSPAPARAARAPAGRTRSRNETQPEAEPEPPAPVRLDRRRIDKLERELRRAERDATLAEDDLADAERRLRRAEEALADATERAKAMADARADAERALDAAQQAVVRARAELEAATGG